MLLKKQRRPIKEKQGVCSAWEITWEVGRSLGREMSSGDGSSAVAGATSHSLSGNLKYSHSNEL